MLNQEILFSDSLDELLSQYTQNDEPALIIYCTAGKLQIELNGEQRILQAHDMLLCQPKQIIGNYMYSPDMRCRVTAIHKHALDDILYVCVREDNKWWEKAQFVQQNPVIRLNERQQELAEVFDRLSVLYAEDGQTWHSEKVRIVFAQATIYEMLGWLESSIAEPQTVRKEGRQEILFREFMQLAMEQAGHEREVRWYADRLSVTPKYLTHVCHTMSGKAASALIEEITVREIKRLLRQTDLTTKEVCTQMRFVSLSFFCKYVKQHLGMTANDYRHKMRQESA